MGRPALYQRQYRRLKPGQSAPPSPACYKLAGWKGNSEQIARPAPSGTRTMGLEGKGLSFQPGSRQEETTSLSPPGMAAASQPAGEIYGDIM